MINTLVTHKTKNLGIGCIAKELKNSYKVNFGTNDVITCKKDVINIIDTSKCKTMSFQELKKITYGNASINNYVIIGNELKEYVGIGWITIRITTLDDLKNYPRVV